MEARRAGQKIAGGERSEPPEQEVLQRAPIGAKEDLSFTPPGFLLCLVLPGVRKKRCPVTTVPSGSVSVSLSVSVFKADPDTDSDPDTDF